MFNDVILKLSKQLYPRGRAFWMPPGGDLEKLHRGLAVSESLAYSDALAILYSILPDNANFSTDDATDWERRLGLISNALVPLSDRKLAIQRKLNFPGIIPTRQNWRYLEQELQSAGFNVYVYENRFADMYGGYDTENPLTLTGGVGSVTIQHGQKQHGQVQHGVGFYNLIANSIDESRDAVFNVGSNLRSTFFVGGNPIGTFANVDVNRKNEFRQLILKIKPVQTVGYLFINYV